MSQVDSVRASMNEEMAKELRSHETVSNGGLPLSMHATCDFIRNAQSRGRPSEYEESNYITNNVKYLQPRHSEGHQGFQPSGRSQRNCKSNYRRLRENGAPFRMRRFHFRQKIENITKGHCVKWGMKSYSNSHPNKG